MCASNCGNCSTCAPDVRPGRRGPQGIPGLPNTLSFSITALDPGDTPTASVTGVSPNQHLAIGFPLAVPGATGATGPAGTAATNLFTNLVSFTVPALNSSTIATVGNTSWMVEDAWLYINGAGYFLIVDVPTATTVQLANPGSVLGWPAGIPGQAAATTVVASDATQTQVIHAAVPGIPGAAGAAGTPGATPVLFVDAVTTIPVAAPAAGGEIVLYYDNALTPTIVAFYAWDGTAWNASPNLIGPDGTIWQTTNGDPNSTLPSGPIGTFVLRTDVLSIYQRTSVSVWTLVGSLTPTFDQVWTASNGLTTRPQYYTPETETHSVAGVFTIDLTKGWTVVDVQAAIELDYTALSNYGEWWLELSNSTGSSKAVTYTTSKWEKNTGATAVTSLAASGSPGDRVLLRFVTSKAKLTITEFITPVAI